MSKKTIVVHFSTTPPPPSLITKVCSKVFEAASTWVNSLVNIVNHQPKYVHKSTWWPGWWSGWHETSEDQWLGVPAKMAGTGFGCHYITYVLHFSLFLSLHHLCTQYILLYFSVFLSLHHLCTVFLCISVTTSPMYCISLFLCFITLTWSHAVYLYLTSHQ